MTFDFFWQYVFVIWYNLIFDAILWDDLLISHPTDYQCGAFNRFWDLSMQRKNPLGGAKAGPQAEVVQVTSMADTHSVMEEVATEMPNMP